jgi:hypothetical protein
MRVAWCTGALLCLPTACSLAPSPGCGVHSAQECSSVILLHMLQGCLWTWQLTERLSPAAVLQACALKACVWCVHSWRAVSAWLQ